MKKLILYLLVILASPIGLIAQTIVTVGGPGADYTTLKFAFDAVNAGTITGTIEIQITGSTVEPVSAILYASGTGSSNYTALSIYPTGTGFSISGNMGTPLIDLDGADNVIIDGRTNRSGTNKDLTILNLSVSNAVYTSTIRFLNAATNNTIRYCILRGSSAANKGGIVFFHTSDIAGTTTGNINNIIEYNNITSNTGARPVNAIFSQGSAAKINSNIEIRNNWIFDFFKINQASSGIQLNSLNASWTITGNSFFETTSFSPTVSIEYNVIRINNNTGNGFIISGNYIGGSSALCSGIPWTKTSVDNSFYAIRLAIGSSVASSIQGNIIKNFDWRNSIKASWTGIQIDAGTANIGTVTGNEIGEATGIGSVTITGGATGMNVYGINIASPSTVICQNNIIGSITAANSNSLYASNIIGINKGIFAGTTTITNNTIGSSSTANSINSTSLSTANPQSVTGINCAGTGNNTISNNSIANLNNSSNNASASTEGLSFAGNSGTNIVSTNFIHSLSFSNISATGSKYGIRINSGSTTFANNIISLGGDGGISVYGIYETGIAGNNNNLYFNTVYIGGSASSGTNNSYALYCAVNTNSRDFRNNILFNARSNSGGSGIHYAAYIGATGGTITCDYNDYFVSGTGGLLGYYGGNVIALPIVTGQDINSRAINPVFISAGGTIATNYQIGVDLLGVNGTGVLTDYGAITRSTPSMGAWERIINKWKGSISTDWNNPGNWTGNTLPAGIDPNIIFDDNPDRSCFLDQNHSVTDIIINQSTDLLVTNGFNLTIKGSLIFTNGAQIDASAINSNIEFAGTAVQSIPSGSFYNNQVYDLIINNTNNVILNGTINLLNTLTATAGFLDAYTTLPTFIYGGSSAQSILSSSFLDSTLYNLTIDNVTGVTLTSPLFVTNILTINAGRNFSLNPSGNLTTNSLNNNGILNLNSTGSSAIFSLIMDNYSGSGTTNAQIYLTGGGAPYYNWHYVAEPFTSGISTTFFTNINAFNLLHYDDSRVVSSDFNGWEYYNGYSGTSGIAGGAGFTTMTFGRGYNFYNGSDANITLTGSTAIGTMLGNTSLQYSGLTPGSLIYGYNLLGNSLTCSLDWDLVTFSGSVNSAVYYTTGNRWATYLPIVGGTNGATKDIPPLQGFFVKANDTGASIDLSGAREHSTQIRYKKSGQQELSSKGGIVTPKVKLELSGTGTSDETIVWYNNDATTGYDEKYDATKMFASESLFSQIYSSLEDNKYVINGIPLPLDSIIIPLGIKIAHTGNFALIKKEFLAPDGYDIFLIDKANNDLTINLKNSNEYSFSSNSGNFPERFQLKVISFTTGIDDPLAQKKDFNIYSFHDIVNIIPMNTMVNSSKGEIKIFDLTGRIVKQINNVEWYEGTPVQVPCNELNGIYMVEVHSGTSRFVGKVIMH